jgi:dTDP-4-dehydrorhamnose reductase
MVKALLVGADGGLGRAFADGLAAASWTVTSVGRYDLDVSLRNDVFDLVRSDKPEVVINAAGFTDVDACEIDKWRAYLVNRDGGEHLSRAAADVGALFVYPSCDLVFDGARSAPYREEDSPNPLNIYGDTKLGAELAIMKHAPKHLILRTGPLFGRGGRGLFMDLFHRWKAGEKTCSAVEEGRAQPTYRADFVGAVIELVKRGATGVWHAAAAGDATPYEFAREAWSLFGGDPEEVRSLRRSAVASSALRPRYSVLDCAKLAGLGIRLRSWKEALRAAVAEVR